MAKIFQKKELILLALILALSFFLRIWQVNRVPPELFGDELDVGYQAYSILKTGKDIGGNFLPVYIQSLAESRAPLFIYSTIPFVAIFGLSEWGVRLTAAFWGILGVLALYLLTQKLFGNFKLSAVSCLLLAISPWHLQYSRAGFEVTLLLFLFMTTTWLFLEGFKKPTFFIFAAVLFALTPYTYSTAVVFMPLFVLSLMIIFRQQLRELWQKTSLKIAVLIFVLVLLPFGWQLIFGQATTRFSQISVALNPAIEKNINEARKIDDGGVFFHNKPLSFLFETSRNYVWAFSPQFLFVDGDPNLRHSVGQMGEFYWFFLPLLLIGFYSFLENKNISSQTKALLFSWLILAPLPASLTYFGTGHATRLFLLLLPLIILGSIGLYKTFQDFLKSKIKFLAILLIAVTAFFNLATYFHRYYIHYPVESWRFWQIGYKEAFAYIKDHQDKYNKIVINNTYEPSLIRFLFYMHYDPAIFHQGFTGDQPQKEILSGIDGFKLDKYYFGTLSKEPKGVDELAKVLDSKMLYLASQRDEIIGLDLRNNPPKNIVVLKTITNYFNEPIFYLLTGTQ
jgi:4-amino-4-deoxy-L-arabinose transferase-like glycosyltransferase